MPRKKKSSGSESPATEPKTGPSVESSVKPLAPAVRLANLNKCVKGAVSGFAPPENLSVSQFADKYRRLSSESSAEPGRWRTSRTLYLKEIMDAWTDPRVRHISVVASSQVGKSECELNIIAYIIANDPGSILFIHPTVIDAKEFSKLRIDPMIRDTPCIRKRVAPPKSRDSSNTRLQKSYPGGIMTMCGSAEAHALASKPIRYVLGDELDRWAVSAGKEGDPWLLAMARQTTFYNAKSMAVSTGTIKGASAIERQYLQGTQERWQTKCPHCGQYHEIQWEDIHAPNKNRGIPGAEPLVDEIWYTCPLCGAISDEARMKKQPSMWVPDNPDAIENGHRSFWISAFVSPWSTWQGLAIEYYRALGNSKALQVVFNTRFGKLWEDRGDLIEEGTLMARREQYGVREDGTPVELPEGVLVLTCGVDTQDNRLEYEVVGHGRFGETWGIQRGVIMGRPDSKEVWDTLDGVIAHRYAFADGQSLRISVTFIDEGGHFTMEVRHQCSIREGRQVYCIKGMSGADRPYTQPPKHMKILTNDRKSVIGYCWQYQIGTDSGKQIIMDNLRVQTPGPHYCHFPDRDDYGPVYFNGLLSERKVYHEGAAVQWRWEIIPGHERNESLDCRNYALAAFSTLNVDMDREAEKLRRKRGQDKPQRPPVSAAGSGAAPRAEARAKAAPMNRRSRSRSGYGTRHFDEW